MFNWSKKQRIKYAFRAGKIEHVAGRAMILAIFVSLVVSIMFKSYIVMLFIMVSLLLASLYLIAHNLEKKLFGSNGPRSGWGKK